MSAVAAFCVPADTTLTLNLTNYLMKTPLTQKTVAYTVAALLVACPLTFSKASSQTAGSATYQQVPMKKTEAPILVRNTSAKSSGTTAKAEKADAVAAPENDKKVRDKKTVGRCWQRLMNMVREVNHAHRAKRKANQ